MNLKLKTLEDFLRKNNFINEAEVCHSLIKLSAPFIDSPVSEEKEYFKINKKDLEDQHGWIYVLKTEPTIGSSAPYAWYVGETKAPAMRWIEHSFGMQKVDEEEYIIPDPLHIEDAIQADIEKGSMFTTRHKVLELVCIELIDYDKSVSNDRARKSREERVFFDLAEFVGSSNIGGNYPHMARAKTLNLPPQSTDEEEIKKFIKSIVNCETGDILAAALRGVKHDDITEEDISAINDRKLWPIRLRKRRAKAMQKASEKLKSMSAEEQQSYRNYIELVVNKHNALHDILKELDMGKADFAAMAKILEISDKELDRKRSKDDEREIENIIKALRQSKTMSQAKKILGYSATNMTLNRKMRAYNISKEELGKEYQHVSPSDEEVQNVINMLRDSKSFAEGYKNLGMTIHNLEKFVRDNNIDITEIGVNFKAKEKQNAINALNNSRTIRGAGQKLDPPGSTHKMTYLINKYELDPYFELGKNLNESID